MRFWILISALFVFSTVPLTGEEPVQAVLSDIDGTVSLIRVPGPITLEAEPDMPLSRGDVVVTGENSSAEITLDDESVIKLEENSKLSLDSLEVSPEIQRQVSVSLVMGKLFASIKKALEGGHQLFVHTPAAMAAVKGTEFAVEVLDEESRVGVFDGQVEVTGLAGSAPETLPTLRHKEPQTTVATHERPSTPRKLSHRWQMQKDNMLALKKRAAAYRLLKKGGDLKKVRELRKLLSHKLKKRLTAPENERLQQFQQKHPQTWKKYKDLNKLKFRKRWSKDTEKN